MQGYVTFDANGDRLPYGHVQQHRRTVGEGQGGVGVNGLCFPHLRQPPVVADTLSSEHCVMSLGASPS